jgi:hypothetical protein
MAIKKIEEKNFTRVEISHTFDFKIIRADSYDIKLDADEGFMKNIDVKKQKDTLVVRHSPHISWMFRLTKPKIVITMPTIKGLRLTGAVTGEVSGFKSKEDFSLSMDGASKVTINLEAGKAEFHVRGACSVDAEGAAETLIVDVNGACGLDMRDFTVNNAAIRLNGASNCTANITGRLDARLAGVSTLNLIGESTIGDIRTSGMSKISKIA